MCLASQAPTETRSAPFGQLPPSVESDHVDAASQAVTSFGLSSETSRRSPTNEQKDCR